MPELHAGSERRIAGLHKLSAVSGCVRNCLLTERRGGCIIRRCLCSDTASRGGSVPPEFVAGEGFPGSAGARNDSVRHRRQQPDPGRKGVRHDGTGTTPRAVPRPLRAVTRGHAPRQSITYRERGSCRSRTLRDGAGDRSPKALPGVQTGTGRVLFCRVRKRVFPVPRRQGCRCRRRLRRFGVFSRHRRVNARRACCLHTRLPAAPTIRAAC